MIKPSEWQEIEEELQGFFGSVKLKLGDHTIQLQRGSLSEGRTAIAVFVNGKIPSEWMTSDIDDLDPLAKTLWRRRTRSLYSPKHRKEIIKIWGKRKVKKIHPDMDDFIVWYEPFFLKAKTLVNQFKKIKEFELLTEVDTENSEREKGNDF